MSDGALLPIFPLSNVVLYPRVQIPLHFFEPRYRALARDVLASERYIGMTTVLPEHIDAMPGVRFALFLGADGLVAGVEQLFRIFPALQAQWANRAFTCRNFLDCMGTLAPSQDTQATPFFSEVCLPICRALFAKIAHLFQLQAWRGFAVGALRGIENVGVQRRLRRNMIPGLW